MVIASCSGEGGAALSRRHYGERIQHLTTRFGYQFARNYQQYGERVDAFPVDAHMLAALVAPRPLLLQTGNTDKWSDPMGEFQAAVAAGPVFELLGKQGLGAGKLPARISHARWRPRHNSVGLGSFSSVHEEASHVNCPGERFLCQVPRA
jgi:hypothetical protein